MSDGEAAERTATEQAIARLTSTRAQLAYLAAATSLLALLLAGVAWSLNGPLSAVAVLVGLVIGVSAPWIYVRILFTPYGKSWLGTAFFVLGQLTFGAGALVRREDGTYVWRRLRVDSGGLFTVLESGRVVRIDGERADLPEVAWAPLAVVEEKTETRMREFTVDETFQRTRPDPAGDKEMVATPLALADGGGDGWHLDASKLERIARGAAGAELPRNGRRKALEEKGGQQQISQWVTMIGAGLLAVVGFGMTAVVMLL